MPLTIVDGAAVWAAVDAAAVGAAVGAAWAADEYMLDRAATVDRALTEALDRGELAPKLGEERDAAGYIGMLRKFFRETGYLRG